MAYIGKQPEFTQYPSKFFNGDGSAMTVTLDYAPPNDAALLVFIDGVRQDTSAYNCTGTSCVFTGSVPSGTNNVQVVHMGLTVDVAVPADDTITTVKIQDDAVTAAKIAANAVGNSEMADDAVGIAELSATGTASATTFLRGDNSWVVPTDTVYNDAALQDDIALLGFRVASNGSLAKYNLVDQTVDDFQDASGVNAGGSTNEIRNSSNYYSGASTLTPTITSNHDSTGTDGDYTWYKWSTVTASGSYVNSVTQDHTYLVVAGGASGGTQWSGNNNAAGGGGAGGMITNYGVGSAQSLTASATYTISVGAGGAADPGNSGEVNGNSGNDSSIAGSGLVTVTGLAGGYGSRGGGGDGADGGSGGGGGAGPEAGGSATQGNIGNGIGYGYDGGEGWLTPHGGGGGGAGSTGWVGSSSNGKGGDGRANSITGAAVTYAAGGGGGGSAAATTGGAGGSSGIGGEGGDRQVNNATAGDVNTGSGGGAGGSSWSTIAVPSGAGGSGIVIIRRETTPEAEGADMTLVSTTTAAQEAPTKGDVVFTYTNGAGTTTLGTDVTAEISADGGSTWTAMTLGSEGSTGAHNIATAHDVTISSTITAPYNMAYRIKTLNQAVGKTTRIQAVSLGWS